MESKKSELQSKGEKKLFFQYKKTKCLIFLSTYILIGFVNLIFFNSSQKSITYYKSIWYSFQQILLLKGFTNAVYGWYLIIINNIYIIPLVLFLIFRLLYFTNYIII